MTLDQEVHSYGVAQAQEAGDAIELHAEELLRNGCTLLPSGIKPAAIDELRATLDETYERQCGEIEGFDLAQSDDADVARALLAYDERFLTLATNPDLLSLCRHVFGESFVLLQQNGVINRPSRAHYQLRWHRDLPFQHWTVSRPIALAALFCVDEFSVETGATYGLPGSQRHPEFPSDDYVRRHQQVNEAPAGTFIVMDAMMFHRAGKNVSDRVRRGINHLVGLPFMGQQIDLPGLLGGQHADDPALARYLGYNWRPAPSPAAWREARNTKS